MDQLKTIMVGKEQVLLCPDCGEKLGLGTYRALFCPKCKWCETGTIPESILCCVDHDIPLLATEGGGSYCARCDFHPSMQDTFLWRLCPRCREAHPKGKCPNGHE